jgi:hypothetical protein
MCTVDKNCGESQKGATAVEWREEFVRFRKGPPLVPALSQMNPVHTFPHYFPLRSILILSSHPPLDLPSDLFSSVSMKPVTWLNDNPLWQIKACTSLGLEPSQLAILESGLLFIVQSSNLHSAQVIIYSDASVIQI